VDAFAASEPTPSLAEERGARELCTFGGLGNLYPIFMLARQDFMRTHAEEFKGFVMALRRAEQYAQTHPQEVVTLMAEQTSLSPKATRAALARHQFRLRLDEAIVHSLHETAAFLHRQGIIEQVPDWQQVVEPSVLVELHESKKE
jgi:sulfonate transport system substrate-binding protein